MALRRLQDEVSTGRAAIVGDASPEAQRLRVALQDLSDTLYWIERRLLFGDRDRATLPADVLPLAAEVLRQGPPMDPTP